MHVKCRVTSCVASSPNHFVISYSLHRSRKEGTAMVSSTIRNRSSNRGFAAMDAAKQREIASKGGRAAHERGSAHEFTAEEAREAGRRGGQAVSKNREHMSEIGRRGGESSHANGNGRDRKSTRLNSSHQIISYAVFCLKK